MAKAKPKPKPVAPKPEVEEPEKPKPEPEKPRGESREEKLRRYIESTTPEHRWDEAYEQALAEQWPEKYGKGAKGKK